MLRHLKRLLGYPVEDRRRDEFWRSYWERLNILFSIFTEHKQSADLSPPEVEIQVLLGEAVGNPSAHYAKLYAVEQRLAMIAPESHLDVEIRRRLTEAEARGIGALASFRELFTSSTDTAHKRATLVALIDEIQLYYLNRSIDRRARREASDRLNNFSWLIVLPTAALLLLVYLWSDMREMTWVEAFVGPLDDPDRGSLAFLADYHLVAIMWFGLVGAYFSRLISFQQTSSSLGREAIETEFSRKTLFIRLTIGVVAAIIMYVLLRANMVAGSLFPDWGDDFSFISEFKVSSAAVGETLGADDFVTGEGLDADGSETTLDEKSVSLAEGFPTGGASTIPLISVQYAQLLVWSLLAGFSERLIPDRFASIESRVARDAGGT